MLEILILIKTNEAGDEIWRNTFGSEFDDYGLDLIQNTNERYGSLERRVAFLTTSMLILKIMMQISI